MYKNRKEAKIYKKEQWTRLLTWKAILGVYIGL